MAPALGLWQEEGGGRQEDLECMQVPVRTAVMLRAGVAASMKSTVSVGSFSASALAGSVSSLTLLVPVPQGIAEAGSGPQRRLCI